MGVPGPRDVPGVPGVTGARPIGGLPGWLSATGSDIRAPFCITCGANFFCGGGGLPNPGCGCGEGPLPEGCGEAAKLGERPGERIVWLAGRERRISPEAEVPRDMSL